MCQIVIAAAGAWMAHQWSPLPNPSPLAILLLRRAVANAMNHMTMALKFSPAQEGILEASSLLESLLLHLGIGKKAHAAKDDPLEGLLRFAISEIGGTLLAAQTVDDLEDRLDAVVLGSKLYHVNALALQDLRVRAIDPAATPGAAIDRAFQAVLSAPAKTLLRNHNGLLEVWLQTQLRLVKRMATPLAGHDMPGPWLLTDPRVPIEVAQVMAATMRASACLLGLALAADEERRLQEDLGLALVTHLVDGAKAHLRLLAAFPDAKVPISVVAEPLDLTQIATLHLLAERRVAHLVAALA